MKRFSLAHYIIFGLLLWGLPAVLVAGWEAAVLTFAAAFPVWWINRKQKAETESLAVLNGQACALILGATLLYLLYDNLFGRHYLSYNLLLFGHQSFDQYLDYANAHSTEGRGAFALLAFVMGFFPFFLADRMRGLSGTARWVIWLAIALLVFNDTGPGRQYLMVAITAFAAGQSSSWRRMLWTALILLGSFAIVSYARGDFSNTALGNPLYDGFAFPFINLALMLNDRCPTSSWLGYMAEFFKKFLPAFIFPKSVFAFNYEMSYCIYPITGTDSSVSIFTYMGEFFYYRPPVITAIISGTLIGFLARFADRKLAQKNLVTTRIFAGLMCIGMPRSRTQDLLSYLLALIIFLLIMRPLMAENEEERSSVLIAEPQTDVLDTA